MFLRENRKVGADLVLSEYNPSRLFLFGKGRQKPKPFPFFIGCHSGKTGALYQKQGWLVHLHLGPFLCCVQDEGVKCKMLAAVDVENVWQW